MTSHESVDDRTNIREASMHNTINLPRWPFLLDIAVYSKSVLDYQYQEVDSGDLTPCMPASSPSSHPNLSHPFLFLLRSSHLSIG